MCEKLDSRRREKRIEATAMLEEGRAERGVSGIHQNMLDTIAETERKKQARRVKAAKLLGVSQREQLPREVKQNKIYNAPYHLDSDDEWDSDDSKQFEDSEESAKIDEFLSDQTYQHVSYDTEETCGMERGEFRKRIKRRKYLKKPRDQPPPVLSKFKSDNRHAQKYTISAGEEEEGEREVVVVQAEQFQI